jgi:hypothetical protein
MNAKEGFASVCMFFTLQLSVIVVRSIVEPIFKELPVSRDMMKFNRRTTFYIGLT